MLDIKFVRENKELVLAGIEKKRNHGNREGLEELLEKDAKSRALRQSLEKKQAERNAKSKLVGELKRKGESADSVLQELSEISAQVKTLEEESRLLEQEIHSLLLELPNLPHESVPYGESDADNQVLSSWGKKPSFDFTAKPHWELSADRDWIDFERGNKTSGAGFPIFKGDVAKLVRALKNFFLDFLTDKGFEELSIPLLVNADSATATGQLPDKEGQMYAVTDGYYLIPTSELVLTGMYRNEILDEDSLPIKHCGFSACFRREAGSYGADVRGLNRLHQFDKVEMVQFVKPEESYNALEEMVAISEEILQTLELPYRKLVLCSGDMGITQSKTYDLEVWSPGQDRWLEVTSVSNITDFQARRLKTRYRKGGAAGKGKTELVHTLNGSALAFPRTIAAILEHYQNKDGSVRVPEALKNYLGKDLLE